VTNQNTEELYRGTLDIISPERYARNGYPDAEWTYLRGHAPVYRYDRANVRPFWAITKHADIIEVSRQPGLFRNAPLLSIATRDDELEPQRKRAVRHLLNMDPPEHGKYRDLVKHRFTPRAVRALEAEISDIVERVMQQIGRTRGSTAGMPQCDFVADVAAPIATDVTAALLGVPKPDRPRLSRWTNAIAGASDPEFQEGTSAQETIRSSRRALFAYFTGLAEKRRKDPEDDISTVLVRSRVDGKPLPFPDMASYFLLLLSAGNETVRNASSGGLLAFVENRDQWSLLRRNPALLPGAVEEILRWTSPVIQFARTAVQDYELRGQKIRAGDSLALFYPSANRDEEVFEEPFKFDISRAPNLHLAFGTGEHFCLGANLARLELRVIFGALLKRVHQAELTGPVERLRSNFAGGIKRMPVRLHLSQTWSRHFPARLND
jgi:cholest-4-en-3-one 26-monooxygenase